MFDAIVWAIALPSRIHVPALQRQSRLKGASGVDVPDAVRAERLRMHN
jgi:hypothetical protein